MKNKEKYYMLYLLSYFAAAVSIHTQYQSAAHKHWGRGKQAVWLERVMVKNERSMNRPTGHFKNAY